jgi:hypothetical protein
MAEPDFLFRVSQLAGAGVHAEFSWAMPRKNQVFPFRYEGT